MPTALGFLGHVGYPAKFRWIFFPQGPRVDVDVGCWMVRLDVDSLCWMVMLDVGWFHNSNLATGT